MSEHLQIARDLLVAMRDREDPQARAEYIAEAHVHALIAIAERLLGNQPKEQG